MKFKLTAVLTIIILLSVPFYYYAVDNQSSNIQSLGNNLKNHVKVISHDIGDRNIVSTYDKLDATAEYIADKFISYGYKPEFQIYSDHKRKIDFKNIIITKSGRNNPRECIVIGAHYDSFYNPGADDNASGVAGMIELAGLMRNIDPNYTIKFVAFATEEIVIKGIGFGSEVYAGSARKNNENFRAVIILDMIGYYTNKNDSQFYPPLGNLFLPNKGNYIMLLGNVQSKWLAKKMFYLFKNNSKFPIEYFCTFESAPGMKNSMDACSFWKYGYPAVLVTDTAFFRNFNYHKEKDTYDTLDYNSMAEVVFGLFKTIMDF